MRKEKNKAISLRKKGHSYNEIVKMLNISKGTLSYWLRDIRLSKEAFNNIYNNARKQSIQALIKRNKNQTILAQKKADKIRKTAQREVPEMICNPLFVSCISLYWAEGYKKGAKGSKWKVVDFTNSDPEMISLMMIFFTKICKVPTERIRAQLIAHPNINIKDETSFWLKLTKIPRQNFIKTYSKISKSSNKIRQGDSLTHGTLHIRIYDVGFFFKIIGWIDGLKDHFGTVAQW